MQPPAMCALLGALLQPPPGALAPWLGARRVVGAARWTICQVLPPMLDMLVVALKEQANKTDGRAMRAGHGYLLDQSG